MTVIKAKHAIIILDVILVEEVVDLILLCFIADIDISPEVTFGHIIRRLSQVFHGFIGNERGVQQFLRSSLALFEHGLGIPKCMGVGVGSGHGGGGGVWGWGGNVLLLEGGDYGGEFFLFCFGWFALCSLRDLIDNVVFVGIVAHDGAGAGAGAGAG